MNDSKISVRYARALFLLAQEKNELDPVRDDILAVKKTISENELLGQYLNSPVVRPSQKIELITKLYKDKLSTLTFNFLQLLIRNKRENHLEGIFRRFLEVYSAHNGIQSASVTTAVPMDAVLRGTILELIASSFKTKVDLTIHEDASIIGGFILRVGDQQYDASVATGLKRIKNSLLTESNK